MALAWRRFCAWFAPLFVGLDCVALLVFAMFTHAAAAWCLAAVAGFLTVLCIWCGPRDLRAAQVKVWQSQGKCAQCGYDLCATPARCPECGTVAVTPPTRPSLPPWRMRKPGARFMLPWVRAREMRREFLEAHQGLTQSDDDFATAAYADATPEQRQIICTLRECLSLYCGIPRETVRSETRLFDLPTVPGNVQSLSLFDSNGIDPYSIYLEFINLAQQGRLQLPRSMARMPSFEKVLSNAEASGQTVGQWIAGALGMLSPEIPRELPYKNRRGFEFPARSSRIRSWCSG